MRLVPSLIALTLAGCSDMSLMGDVGVTPGGNQDIKLAREIIASGGIPGMGWFTPEGLFSEHDLPLPGDPCEQTLCGRVGVAPVDPVDGSGPQVLAQLGFATDLDLATFERAPQDIVAVVDTSCSMGGDKIAAVRDALGMMVDDMTDDDRVALVSFSTTAKLRRGMITMDAHGRDLMHGEIAGLVDQDSTDIDAGMRLGFEQFLTPREGAQQRMILLTDAQPNVGPTDPESFLGMTRSHARDGIGLTIMGVGLDLGADLSTALSNVRGANSVFLADPEAVRTTFEQDFDFLVSPIAYDLDVAVEPLSGAQVTRTWGTPTDGGEVKFGAATLFLSRRNGGMGVTFTAPEAVPASLARFTASYETLDGQHVSEGLSVNYTGEELPTGATVMGHLIDEVLALEAGAHFCDGSLVQDDALAQIDEAATRLDAAAEALGEPSLVDEADLMRQLAVNVRAGGECVSDGWWSEE